MPNLPEYAVPFHGAASAGGHVHDREPALHRRTSSATSSHDSGREVLFTVPPFLDNGARGRRAGRDRATSSSSARREGATPFAELLGEPEPTARARHRPADDLAVLPYSSGTTGLPKGVMLTHRNLVANVLQTGEVSRSASDDVLIGCLPFFHIYGMTVIMNHGPRNGATIVTMPRFDLEQFLGLIEEHGARVAYVVPPIALASPSIRRSTTPTSRSLRMIMSGAAPLGAELAERGRRARSAARSSRATG